MIFFITRNEAFVMIWSKTRNSNNLKCASIETRLKDVESAANCCITDCSLNYQVLLIGRKITSTRKVMFLSCDNECSISRIKMFEVAMRVREWTAKHEYKTVWWQSQWSETTSLVELFLSHSHTHTLILTPW